jgi:dihydroorotate dehydrogenase (NAD+) catalytic subunit
MIDLAPNHKLGLLVSNPILLAGGMIGYGEARHAGTATEQLGAVVVGPLLLNSRVGAEPPRLAAANSGFVLETGGQNRGIHAVIKQFAALWPRLGCPVVAQLADSQPAALGKLLTRLADVDGLSGLELLFPRQGEAEHLRALVQTVWRESDLPLWVKLPLERVVELAPVAVEAGAAGIVVGQPPLGASPSLPHLLTDENRAPSAPTLVHGALYGPLVFPLMLAALVEVNKLALPCALIACGGIHTLEQTQTALAAGAQAVQIDSAVWVEPGLPVRLAQQPIMCNK